MSDELCVSLKVCDHAHESRMGEDIPISDLASLVAGLADYQGNIDWDSGKPDGTPRKLLDVSRIHALGWKAEIELREGISRTYAECARQH